MSLIDRFLNAIKLSDDFDEDDDFLDDDEETDVKRDSSSSSKKKNRYFSRFDDDEDEDDEDFDEDFDDEEPPKRRTSARSASSRGRSASTGRDRSSSGRTSEERRASSYESSRSSGDYSGRGRAGDSRRSSSYGAERESRRESDRKSSKRNSSGKRKDANMKPEVNVIRPSSVEDAWQIADTLIEKSMVVLNLEGLDVDVAQRVVDFSCGACYSLKAEIKKISSYIFLLTPEGVDTSGDYQNILDGTFDIPSMRGRY